MTAAQSQQTPHLLADYRPYPFAIRQVRLDFALDPKATVVRADLDMERAASGDLVLDIGAGVVLHRLAVDGVELAPTDWTREAEVLTIHAALPDRFTLHSEVTIDPSTNTAFEGLYLSNGMFCTQCEAEGFRHITPYPDRPDVMAPFEVTIHSDLPVLLSNGNPLREEPGLAVWHSGHIGVYIGNGEVIEAMGTKYGVVKTQLSERSWTAWLEVPYITYITETEETP